MADFLQSLMLRSLSKTSAIGMTKSVSAESCAHKAHEKTYSHCTLKPECKREKSYINLYILFNELLHLTFPAVFCAVLYLVIWLCAVFSGLRYSEGKVRKGEGKCGRGVRAIFDLKYNSDRCSLLHDSCAGLTSFQI